MYTTPNDVKRIYGDGWSDDDEFIDMIQYYIEVSEAKIRVEFKERGRNMNQELDDDTIELVLFKDVVSNMVKRAAKKTTGDVDNNLPEGVTQVSQSAGPYSSSLSFSGLSGSMVFFTKEDKASLGLGIVIKSFNTIKVG